MSGVDEEPGSSGSDSTALDALAANARLDADEAQVLRALVEAELGGRRTTLQTLRDELDAPALFAVGLGSRLRRCGFVQVVEHGPWGLHEVVLHPNVLWALLGDPAADPALPVDTRLVQTDEPGDGDWLVLVTGDDKVRRREEAFARTAGNRFLVTAPPSDGRGWEALVREATLSGAGILVELDEELSADGRTWITRADHLPWALTSRLELPLTAMPNRPWTEYTAAHLDPDDGEWAAALGVDQPRTHRLSPEQLELVSRAYIARHGDLDDAVRRLVAGRLEQLAQRIRPRRSWDDIVLEPGRANQLRGIVDRYRHSSTVYDEWGFTAQPSRGLVALFSGVSGTGKTLAAEIIAGELGLDVFKLDLSAVVSKYIGETEKNLDQIFDAAGTGNVVLFFDEADSLFGKRSEVKDARDRYANIEVSYLLQRLERYDGVVVLATNFEKNVDDAFLRRIHVRIEFVVPAAEERRSIWERNLPATAPLGDVDLDFLSNRFEMSGGAIRNASVHAAFIAAAAGTPITMECAVRGVAREFRKLGRLLKVEQFEPWFELVSTTD